MDPITLGLLGLGAGGVKSLVEAGQADAERKRQAEMLRISPWTGIVPNLNVKDPNIAGNLLSGAVGGAMLGKNIGDAEGGSSWLDLFKSKEAAGAAPVFTAQAGGLGVDTGVAANGDWALLQKYPWLAGR